MTAAGDPAASRYFAAGEGERMGCVWGEKIARAVALSFWIGAQDEGKSRSIPL
jgi:hypothetical protein